jgi:hypothetical protein
MRSLSLGISLFTLLIICPVNSGAQGKKFPTPPQPSDPTINNQRADHTLPHQQVDFLELQRESRELSDLAHTVPADVESVSHGLLPKDLMEKLKRIEKLSKDLRSKVRP